MVQRKNSLGYFEFIRGRYNLSNIESVKYLLEQMVPHEIFDINNKDFDFLWNNLWDENNIKNKNHQKEYIMSKQKFDELKIKNSDLLKSTNSFYSSNEWGFPKGRREMYESDLLCAIREFEEETNYNESMYNLFENCNFLRENLIGTNGVKYVHNYYLALLIDISNISYSNNEIGDIKLMNITECINAIRPYHNNKLLIIIQIYNLINNFIKSL
jgi:8-oxo-dGTP pyrophosphatase MutT (NUDIX family)